MVEVFGDAIRKNEWESLAQPLWRAEQIRSMERRWAEQEGVPLATALACIGQRAAAIIGRSATLAVDAVADLTVFDPARPWQPSRTTLKSQGLNTPFAGIELTGRVRWTLVGGRLAHADE